jgi:hypothetical protein
MVMVVQGENGYQRAQDTKENASKEAHGDAFL